MNVFFNDVNYLWGIVAQVLFFATPIIYDPEVIDNSVVQAVTNWGPTGSFIRASHNILYDNRFPSAERWLHLVVVSVAVFALGTWIFGKLSPRFAEEL